jgi:TonB family protein
MRTLLRWAARLYPDEWRARYGGEFDALLEDISPSFGDVCDVLANVVRVRVSAVADCLIASVAGSSMVLRRTVVVSLSAHALIVLSVLVAAVHWVSPVPPHVLAAPLPPPVPEAPPQMTDARVFPEAFTLYSSLPLVSEDKDVIPLYVADGVGIHFLTLPDIGALYRNGDVEWRVWPGQALERFIVRRVLPEYPRNAEMRGAVSVFVEYLIGQDGSVKVLRSSGPAPFAGAARRAIEQWRYRPLGYEDRRCQVVSRVEVRFDGEFVRDETP